VRKPELARTRNKCRANVNISDLPFDRHLGDPPAMISEDEADIIAFLKTLTDGYQPKP
jgi:cytochrome c peroxidase